MGGTNKVTSIVSLMGDGTFSANATSANGALVVGAVIGVAGKTLTLDGTSTATNTVSSIRTVLSVVKNGTGYWQLNGSVNDFSGLTLNNGTLVSAGDKRIGANGSTVTINGGTLTSVDSTARIWTNSFVVGGNFTLGQATGGTGALTLLGNVNLGGGVRTITINNVAASGDFLPGIISNGGINKTGLGTMVLSNANTYAAGTTVSMGTLLGKADGAFGTGNVTVEDGATLSLTNGVTKDYINDLATLILGTNSTLVLGFTGTDTIGALSLDGGTNYLANGTYDAATLTGLGAGTYTGTGSLTVIPEPATIGMLGLGALITMLVRRMRTC
jgi:autotransporter-associated beta strand protein